MQVRAIPDSPPWGVHNFRLGESENAVMLAGQERFGSGNPIESSMSLMDGRIANKVEAGSATCFLGGSVACEKFTFIFSQPEAGNGLMSISLEESFGRDVVSTNEITKNLRHVYGDEQRRSQLQLISPKGGRAVFPTTTKLVWSRRPIPEQYDPSVFAGPAELSGQIGGGEIVVVLLQHLPGDEDHVQGVQLLAVELDLARITASALSGRKRPVDPTF